MLALHTIFDSYAAASYGVAIGRDGIDGTRFLKFCKDVQIFDSSAYKKEDVDIVFAKFREPSCNILSFKGFRGAISHIAKKLHVSSDELVKYIVSVSPQASPNSSTSVTIPLPNRLHDDINLYTGVHRLKFAASDKDLRMSRKAKTSLSSGDATELPSPLRERYGTRNPSPYMGLYSMSPPSHSISPSKSKQLNQYHHIVSHTQSLDEYRPRHSSSSKIVSATPSGSYLQNFLNSYSSQENPMSPTELLAQGLRSPSPPLIDGPPSAAHNPNRYSNKKNHSHDIYTSLSLSNFDGQHSMVPLSPPSNQVLLPPPPPPPPTPPLQQQQQQQLLHQLPPQPAQALTTHGVVSDPQLSNNHQSPNNSHQEELQNIFEAYIFGTQPGVDGARFLKFCKDFQLFDHSFRNMDVDVVFAKYKEVGQRYLSFRGFQSALHHIAKRRRLPSQILLGYVLRNSHCVGRLSGGIVVPIPTRFHDDPSSYTGVHRSGGPTVINDDIKDLSRMVDRSIINLNSTPPQPFRQPSPPRRALAQQQQQHSP